MLRGLRAVIATFVAAATLASCNDASPNRADAPSPAVSATAGPTLTVDRVRTTVYRDNLSAAAFVRNSGAHGIRDIELSIEMSAGGTRVMTLTDVLAFCPARATCPWGTAVGVTEEAQRSIDSANVTIRTTGPTFDDGRLTPIQLTLESGSVSFDLPAREGVAILYAVDDEGDPYFGMFTSHQLAEPTTIRLTDGSLPVGPRTRGIFYEGHVPDVMRSGGH